MHNRNGKNKEDALE